MTRVAQTRTQIWTSLFTLLASTVTKHTRISQDISQRSVSADYLLVAAAAAAAAAAVVAVVVELGDE